MTQPLPKPNVFLDPVYINEKSVLNCAAYLFGGAPTESVTGASEAQEKRGGIRLRVPFLSAYLGLPEAEGTISSSNSEQSTVARRFTVGGLHMAVLDELMERGMVCKLFGSRQELDRLDIASFLEIDCVLEESDYSAYLGTLKMMSPLVAQLLKDYGDKILPNDSAPSWMKDKKRRDTTINSYKASIDSLIQQLEQDYMTARQLEMVMWNPSRDRPIGVVDLDLSDSSAAELKARLNGGRYKVIGKATRVAGEGETINLLQKTTLARAIELTERIASFVGSDNEGSVEAVLRSLREGHDLLRLQLQGPAVRVTAMSVCI